MEDLVRTFCELIVKYNDNERVVEKAIGVSPESGGVPINYNLVKGIDINNSKKSIGTIYKRLARLTHSDKTQDGADDFKNLNNAVEELRGDPNGIGIGLVLAKLLEMQTPQTQSTMGESSATPRENVNVSYSNSQYKWQPFTQQKADAAATEVKREEQRAFERKRKQGEGQSSINEHDATPLNFETVMNAFINEYINFFNLNPLKGETNGEIDPYFYAKNKIEHTYPGVTILPFDGDNEETFNANIKNVFKGVEGSQLPSFEGKFEVVKSYNVKRVATAKEKEAALAQIDKNIQKRIELLSEPFGTRSSGTKKSYTSSVLRKGGSKTKRNRKRNKPKTKRNRNKSKQKRSRKTRR